jgi:hypothetical protein
LNRYSFDLGRQEHIDSLLSTCKLYGSVQCKKAEKSGRRNMISIQPANIRQAWYAALLLSMLGLASSVSFAVEAADAPESTDAVKSEECLKFEADVDADLGEVLKAGCKPTLAQMSALMDNPLGNVAMLFTQFDYYKMQDPESDNTACRWTRIKLTISNHPPINWATTRVVA